MGKRSRGALEPEDVLQGRIRPDAPGLCALIRAVNPTGAGVPRAERGRRYALKSQLQSLLVLRFGDELDVVDDPSAGEGFVLLEHRPSGATAAHALVAELDVDARAWVQRRLDLHAAERSGAGHVSSPRPATPRSDASSLAAPDDSRDDLLRRGRRAAEDYDYDTARSLFTQALERSSGAPPAAEALLELFVERLGADAEALALAGSLGDASLSDPRVRCHLAVASARAGDRPSALAFVKGIPGAHAAAALALLARRALQSGDTDTAARDLADARGQDPSSPDLRAIEEAIEQTRAAARRPLEERVIMLAAEGRFDEADVAARDPRLESSSSAPFRTALRTIQEHLRRARAGRLVARAEEALRADELQTAIGLLRQALVEQPAHESPRVAELLAEAESAEQARVYRAEADTVVKLLTAPDPTEGLVAYVGLAPAPRARVQETISLDTLRRLDQTGVHASGARARAAVAAVLALARAELLAETTPEAALALLQQHERLLAGVRSARMVRERAEAAHGAKMRVDAHARLDAARDLLTPLGLGTAERFLHSRRESSLLEAQALLADGMVRHLDERERADALALRRAVTDTLTLDDLGRHLTRMVRRGEIGPARAHLEEEAARAEPPRLPLAGSAVESLRRELDWHIQGSFGVHVAGEGARELVDRGLCMAFVTGRPVPMPQPWWVIMAARGGCESLLDGRTFVRVDSTGPFVFVRFIDLSTPVPLLRSMLVIKTPDPFTLHLVSVREDGMVMVDDFGAVLALSLPDFRIRAWRKPANPVLMAAFPELAMPWLLETCAISADMRRVWLVESPEPASRRLRVLDIDRSTVIHEEPIVASMVRLEQLDASPGVETALVGEPPGTIELRGADGKPVEGGSFVLDAQHRSVVSHPRGGMAALVRAPDGALCAARLVPGTAPASLTPLGDSIDATVVGCASDMVTSRVFALIEMKDKHSFLLALAAEESGFTELYRLPVTRRSQLLIDTATHRPALLVVGRDVFAKVALDASLPELPVEPEPLPILDVPFVRLLMVQCHRSKDGGPLHPLVEAARAYANAGSWGKVASILRGADPSDMDDPSARHYAHLRCLSLLDAGEYDQALHVVRSGISREGPCDLDGLLAIAAPLDDDREVAPAQRTLRDLLRRVAAADACLADDDARGALAQVDDLVVWEACELQSAARLSRALLDVDSLDPDFVLRKLFSLAVYVDLHDERGPRRRELFLRGRWDPEQLFQIRDRALAWLDAMAEMGLPDAGDN